MQKCALPDKSVNFGTQVPYAFKVKKNDGSTLPRPFYGRHLGFQDGRHREPIFLNIRDTKIAREFISVATPTFLGSTNHMD